MKWAILLLTLLLVACQESPTDVTGRETAVSPTVTMSTTIPAQPTTPTDAILNTLDCTPDFPEQRQFPLPPWPNTNFCQHSVPYSQFRSGGVARDSIPAIDNPRFETVSQTDRYLADIEPVLVVTRNEQTKIYPIQVLIWHEIVNDVLADQPIVVTYCPLCNAGLVFARTANGQTFDFGVSGVLRNADLVMYDRQTESWWQQFSGKALVGELTGTQLTLIGSNMVSWADAKSQFPAAQVLSADTGYERLYGENPYINYDALSNDGTRFFDGEVDPRLHPKMRVQGLVLGQTAVAYPYDILSQQQLIEDEVAGEPLIVFWEAETTSPLYNKIIAESRQVGSATLFSRQLDGQTLNFMPVGAGGFIDQQTGSRWNLWGTAVSGPLAGAQLTPLPAHELFWFAWAAFMPETAVYGQ